MKLEVVLSLFLLAATNLLGALPLEMSWRTPISQNDGEKSGIRASASDADGNIILGMYRRKTTGFDTGVIVKLNPAGEEQWQLVLENTADMYISHLGTDAEGNIYFTTGNYNGVADQQVMLVKLSPAGVELWRRLLGEHPSDNRSHGFRIAPDGTVWISLYRLIRSQDGLNIIKCISPAGEILWSKEFFGVQNYQYSSTIPLAVDNNLTVDNGGNVYFSGFKLGTAVFPESAPYISYLCKLDAGGVAVWTNEVPDVKVSHVMVATSGKIGVSGLGGYAFYDAAGGLIQKKGYADDNYLLQEVSSEGKFLLLRVHALAGVILVLTNPDSEPEWQTLLGLNEWASAISNPAGGWFVGGYRFDGGNSWYVPFSVQAVAADGSRRWAQELGDAFHFEYYYSMPQSFLDVHGGLLRIAANEQVAHGASTVTTAAFDLPAVLPDSLIQTFPVSSQWSGVGEKTLSVSPQGSGPFSYQWYYMAKPIDGETNQTLTLLAKDYPSARGYYHVEVSDGEHTVASPLASVSIGKIALKIQDSGQVQQFSFKAVADIGTRFNVESSPDLLTWNVVGYFRYNTNHVDVTVPAWGEKSFYRATKVD